MNRYETAWFRFLRAHPTIRTRAMPARINTVACTALRLQLRTAAALLGLNARRRTMQRPRL